MSDRTNEPRVFTDEKLHLSLPPGPNGTRPRKLKWRFKENNITLVVDYGIFNDKTQRPITHETPLDPEIFNGYMELLEYAIKSKTAVSWEIENWGHAWRWDKDARKSIRDTERSVLSKVSLGRHENGVIFIAVAVKGRDTLEFTIQTNEWMRIMQNGETVPASTSSTIMAGAYVKLLRDVHNIEYVTNWKEPEYRKRFRMEMAAKHGQGGGQRSGGGQGNGGYNKPSTPANNYQSNDNNDIFDDDIPF